MINLLTLALLSTYIVQEKHLKVISNWTGVYIEYLGSEYNSSYEIWNPKIKRIYLYHKKKYD